MKRIALAALAACLLSASLARAETIILRDERGRRTGTVERVPGGVAVLRDERGRRTGTVERQGDSLVRRDALGRRTGTVERR